MMVPEAAIIYDRLARASQSEMWQDVVKHMRRATHILMFGNGGCQAVAEHAAADMSRYAPKALVLAPDSACRLTACANDYGYREVFRRWIAQIINVQGVDRARVVVIGLSASGRSPNVVSALRFAASRSCRATLVCGRRPRSALLKDVSVIPFDVRYYHTAEVLCLLLMYDAMLQLGGGLAAISARQTPRRLMRSRGAR